MEQSGEQLPQQLSATNAEGVLQLIADKKAAYPILIAPWGEHGNARQYVVTNELELREAVTRALKDSSHDQKVHVIQGHGKPDAGRIVTHIDN